MSNIAKPAIEIDKLIDKDIKESVLKGVTADFKKTDSIDLLDRWTPHHEWLENRAKYGLDPYSKYTTSKISTQTIAHDRWGREFRGINFASQEYLSLSSHPKIIEAANNAALEYGVHSAGSAALMGNTLISQNLEKSIAKFIGLKDCTVFPTGWGAGYGVIKTLISQQDHVVMDILSHACLQEGARNATKNIHTFTHLSEIDAEQKLKTIRESFPDAGILVVTETLFSMDSDTPDISALQELCKKYKATLLVDMAHDLGCFGPTGRGFLEVQDMLGKVDIVMGSFSKAFASNGGYVATNHPALKLALRYNCGPLTFTNAISPIQTAIVSACLEIMDSEEGAQRRNKLMENIIYLRNRLQEAGFEVFGEPSAIVPVKLGSSSLARFITKYTLEAGALVNLVEYPAVAKDSSRWRLQVMSDHTTEQIDELIEILVEAKRKAEQELNRIEFLV